MDSVMSLFLTDSEKLYYTTQIEDRRLRRLTRDGLEV